ncbi:MAG TPA: cation diffusion facilitator family transporter [Anaerolineae bacterium]|nr:cation diffusion facilitator family transporter [Anaerolineae bacterium]
MRNKRCKICEKRIAWVGIWVNLALVFLKLLVGFTSGSKACIADALHSGSNIITAFAIILSQKISSKSTSKKFHYGYGKIEFVAAGFISLLIISGAAILITISIRHLMRAPSTSPHLTALLMGLISIGVNEMVFRYMRCVGTQFKSQTMLANAWANRADCFSSMAVVVGVVGARLGFHHLDPIAALFVVAIIIKVSIKILIDSVKALMDTSVNNLYGEEIKTIVESLEDIRGISDLRTRHIGQKVWVDLSILVDNQCTLEEGERISERVREMLLKKIMDLEQVFVHFEPVEEEC